MNTIWSTFECNAWSRNFEYVDYVKMFNRKKQDNESAPVSEKTYNALCKAFDISLEEQE